MKPRGGLLHRARMFVEHSADLVITRGDPKAMVMRAHNRRMIHDPEYQKKIVQTSMLIGAMIRARGYGGTSGAWVGPHGATTDADSSTRYDRQQNVNDARMLGHTDALLSGLDGLFTNNVIGDGGCIQSKTGDKDKDDRLEALWKTRQDSLDSIHRSTWQTFARMVFKAAWNSGEVYLHPINYESESSVEFEVIEADRIATPLGKHEIGKGNVIVDGVERDSFGRIVAYHVAKQHPGSTLAIGTNLFETIRIPWDRMIRLWEPERPGQTRGITRYHAVLTDMRDLQFLVDASKKRMEVAACFAAFIESNLDIKELMGPTALSTELADDTADVIKSFIEPGMIYGLRNGEKLSTLKPDFPSPELFPFVKMLCMRIGTALNITWEEVLGNWQEDSWSSARVGLLNSRAHFKILQQWFGKIVVKQVWKIVHQDLRLHRPELYAGITDADIDAMRWMGPGWRWVDPKNEADAVARALSIGMTNLAREYGALGLDWEEEIRELASEIETLEKLGLHDLVLKIFGQEKVVANPAEQSAA